MPRSPSRSKAYQVISLAALVAAATGCGGGGGSGVGPGAVGGGGAPIGAIPVFRDLGPVVIGTIPTAINNRGEIAGAIITVVPAAYAVVWKPGSASPTSLPGPGENGSINNQSTAAQAINDNGLIVGNLQDQAGNFFAVQWPTDSTSPVSMVQPNVPFPVSLALTAVNNSGQVVGNNFGTVHQAFYWPSVSSSPVALNPLELLLQHMNDAGLAVGETIPQNTPNPTAEYFKINVNSATTATDMGLSAPAAMASIVVNRSGTIVLSSGPGANLVQIDSSGRKRQLGTGEVPTGINSNGDVVGYTLGNNTTTAFVYTPAKGFIDLNKFVSPGTGWVLTSATLINDSGLVVGTGLLYGGAENFALQLPSGSY